MANKFKRPVMIGANRRDVVPGGIVLRRRPHRETSMEAIRNAATRWLNVKGPAIQKGFSCQ